MRGHVRGRYDCPTFAPGKDNDFTVTPNSPTPQGLRLPLSSHHCYTPNSLTQQIIMTQFSPPTPNSLTPQGLKSGSSFVNAIVPKKLTCALFTVSEAVVIPSHKKIRLVFSNEVNIQMHFFSSVFGENCSHDFQSKD